MRLVIAAFFAVFLVGARSVSAEPKNVVVAIGPSLVHVKKNSLDYKLWVFSINYEFNGQLKDRTFSCLFSESDSAPPSIDECNSRAKANKVKADIAVVDPKDPESEDEVIESGMTCRYDSLSPMVVTMPDGDTVCATPKICKDGNGSDEVSHISCPLRPGKAKGMLNGKEREFFICPRLKPCENDKFIAKNVGRRISLASEQRANAAVTPGPTLPHVAGPAKGFVSNSTGGGVVSQTHSKPQPTIPPQGNGVKKNLPSRGAKK